MTITETKRQQCEKTLYHYLQEHAARTPDKVWLSSEREEVTFREALARVEAAAVQFLRCGMKKGDLLALRATRCIDTVLLAVAAASVGAVAALTDAHFPVQTYRRDTGVPLTPAFILSNEDAGDGLSAGGNWKLSGGGRTQELAFAAEDAARAESGREAESGRGSGSGRGSESGREAFAAAAKAVRADDPFMIIFTSGSTGTSKAVLLSHKNCVANPADAMPLFGQGASDAAIALLPLNHVFGFAVASCSLFCGHELFFPRDLDIEYILQCIERRRISVIYSVPTFFLELLKDGRNRKYDLSSLRLGLMAGGPFTAEQMRFIEGELGLRLMPGYGMSECVGISTSRFDAPVEERAAGVGKLYPMTEAFVLGEDGRRLGCGEEGEICVRGMTLMLGYYGDEAATREAIDADGFLHTGDLGYFDAGGTLYISGRKKDIIIRSGNNISTVGVEKKIMGLPCVYTASVVGIRDAKSTEAPAAMVVLKTGCARTEEQLLREMEGVLTRLELPVRVKVVSSLPLTTSGKPDKLKIKAALEEAQG